MNRVAFITGITGQDGSYLAEFLLEKGYKIHGMIRRSSNIPTTRIDHIFNNPNVTLHYGDITDGSCLIQILTKIKNTYFNPVRSDFSFYLEYEVLEIYNLAAQSHVKISFEMPEYTAETDGISVLKLLEAVQHNDMSNYTRIYQASTSELFGDAKFPQNENTPLQPRSPYAIAKLYAYWIVKNYREAYNMYCCNGILFNHTSPRRGHNFIERKISLGIAKILKGESDRLVVGNIYSKRDIGYSKDFVEGMWLMLQQPKNNVQDFVLATGETYTIKEIIEKMFSFKGFNIKWKGSGVDEIGYDENTGRELIFIDSKYYRPTEVDNLLGDSTKAYKELGWKPKIDFNSLLKMLIDHDCN